MKLTLGRAIAICASLAAVPAYAAQPESHRLELAADSDWKFFLGDPIGAETRSFQDASWRAVNLPHDWSIEGKPEKNNPTASGGGFFPAGIGWYRKMFSASPDWKGKRVSIEFDGVYRDATVYLNGQKLGTHPYGYTSFSFDLTPDLDFTAANLLAVRVDNSAQPNSRWYSGSGIYRHVRVIVTDPTHVSRWGVFITTPEASTKAAKVSVRTRVANESTTESALTLRTALIDHADKTVGYAQSPLTVTPGSESETSQQITIAHPALWSPNSPTLYRARTQVFRNKQLIDEVVTPFGVRTLAWSSEKGLLLNGQSIKLTGGSVHHDNGPLGSAAFDRAEERRVELLKAAGHNAVRTAHNPPSSAFLDACDRLGLLVLDEPFDTWKSGKVKYDYSRNFDEWWQRDISAMVLRDRNHPSIVLWGIGNEIPDAFVERGGAIARQLAAQVRSLDTTRPLTEAFPGNTAGPSQDAVFSVLDIGGYNYNLAKNHAEDRRRFPSRIMLTTESFPAEAFEQWQLVKDNPFVIGEFVWTAIDYLGESGIGSWAYVPPGVAAQAGQISGALKNLDFVDKLFTGMANGVDATAAFTQNNSNASPSAPSPMNFMFPGYPWHAADCGDIDLIGHRKPQSYYRDILWNGGDRVYATVRLPESDDKKIIALGWAVYPTLPSWTWPGQEGKELQVEVYSGADKVRLFLNDKLIGEKPTKRDQQFKATFLLAYQPGTLKAVGLRGDRAVAENVLTTAGPPARVRLTADRTTLQADDQDLSFVTVETLDSEGRFQPNSNQEINFTISGPGIIAAVGNADGQDGAPYQGDRRKLFDGRALVVVRTTKQSGLIRLTASTPGLSDAVITIQTANTAPRPELK